LNPLASGVRHLPVSCDPKSVTREREIFEQEGKSPEGANLFAFRKKDFWASWRCVFLFNPLALESFG
jgi:hypothetical protein